MALWVDQSLNIPWLIPKGISKVNFCLQRLSIFNKSQKRPCCSLASQIYINAPVYQRARMSHASGLEPSSISIFSGACFWKGKALLWIIKGWGGIRCSEGSAGLSFEVDGWVFMSAFMGGCHLHMGVLVIGCLMVITHLWIPPLCDGFRSSGSKWG